MAGFAGRARKGAFVLRRTVRRAAGRLRGAPRLTWSIRISAPAGPEGDVWGDVYYAEDLAAALRRLGQEVYVDRLDQRERPVARLRDDVVLQLTGLHRPKPVPGAVNVFWVISHPEYRHAEELRPFDLRYAASGRWAIKATAEYGFEVRALPQATAPERFSPRRSGHEISSDVLFVGKTRRIFRPIVRDALAAGADLTIYGDGWGDFIDPSLVAADFLDNARVPDAYRGARLVLNDHWTDMAEEGFLSNRLFDAVAAGARVVSDPVTSDDADFGGAVRFAATPEELAMLLDPADLGWPDDERMREIAADVAARHSFDRRAETLLADVLAVRGR